MSEPSGDGVASTGISTSAAFMTGSSDAPDGVSVSVVLHAAAMSAAAVAPTMRIILPLRALPSMCSPYTPPTRLPRSRLHGVVRKRPMDFRVRPIGVIRSPFHEKSEAPRQGVVADDAAGEIVLDAELADAVADLE